MSFFHNFVRIFAMFVFAFMTTSPLVAGVPISAHEVIVFNPIITAPKAAAAWARGSRQLVQWETKDIPPQSVHNTGVLLLGYMENDSENLDIDHPLAAGFPITGGSVEVIMPEDISPRDDYFVVLFGDSGNRSQIFGIN